ncbi:MAG TPA: hypothetical protein VKD26_05765 [Streptosporangiaceae bacterium]|nr:hypothetical protein [Streptosporangiaceae bacterium]
MGRITRAALMLALALPTSGAQRVIAGLKQAKIRNCVNLPANSAGRLTQKRIMNAPEAWMHPVDALSRLMGIIGAAHRTHERDCSRSRVET